MSMLSAEQIFEVLRREPNGLTSNQVALRTRTASYNASGRLSKLASHGFLERVTIAGKAGRWRLSIETVATLAAKSKLAAVRPS